MAGKRDKGKDARRRAQMERLVGASGGTGDTRRARERESAARAAAAGPSAARWLVADRNGEVTAVDVVAALLQLDPRTSLRGRGDDALRGLAGVVADLVEAGARTPSGRELVEVVTDDVELREALRPAFDLDALLAGGPVAGDRADRTVRLAETLLVRAAQHRAGEVDLHELVAPVGQPRHALADEVETTVRVATDGLDVPAGLAPAVVAVTGGWIGVDRVELFLAAGRGLLTGTARDVGGAAIAAWCSAVHRDGPDPRWHTLRARIPVDATALVDAAASRAGSDHPDVMGAAVIDLIAVRHPIAPPR